VTGAVAAYRPVNKGFLPHQAARALGLNPAGISYLTAADQALAVLRHFLSSDASDFDEFRVKHRYRSEVLAAASRLWARMIDPQDRLPMLHDGYLKLFQLSNPMLGYGVVLLDGANPAGGFMWVTRTSRSTSSVTPSMAWRMPV